MDVMQHLATTTDLELRVAKIADPSIDLKTKHVVASEIREMLDTIRDSESARVLPYLIPPVLELLRLGEPAFHKETVDYAFRRVLFEILNRLPANEAVRAHAPAIISAMIHAIRNDNEENGVTACKTVGEVIRSYRAVTPENITEFLSLLLECFQNIKEVIVETLSENSPPWDPNVTPLSRRSFKVLGEMTMVVVVISQSLRPMIASHMPTVTVPAFELLSLESPAQKKARVDYEAMGGTWAGMAPSIKNPTIYNEFIQAQIKMLSFLAYVMRFPGEHDESYGDNLLLHTLRLLQDCPSHAIALRKEIMVVFRHLMGTNHRRALFPHLDKLFDENLLFGSGIGSKEMFRGVVYSAVADLVHHTRNDLSSAQLEHAVQVYSRLIHNPVLTNNLHTLFAKMMFGLAEAISNKEPPQQAARLLGAMFETCLERLEALCLVQDEVTTAMEKSKHPDAVRELDPIFIEKSRPVAGAVYAVERPEDILVESRMVFRTLLHGFRVCLAGLKKCDAPTPDGTLVFRLFEASIRCLSLFEGEHRLTEQNEANDWLGHVFMELNLHVFQEMWTQKMEFFFDMGRKRMGILTICQYLFNRDTTSPTLLAIVLRFLMERLPLLGEYDDMTAAASIRLFKLAFSAVCTYPVLNEPILAMHLAKLLTDVFPLAAKATKPMNYYHLLRVLFRSIGGGGGRFELLYREVLPLLPEMLDSLNRQIMASEGQTRDMIVELCLTVPLRLTHLLPHLAYLMRPLALALRGNPELVAQGLRTLELCIDNLTPDFLDPTLSTVLRELMEALHSHLKPAPANHQAAHTTIRILGKLGGRNRRLLTKEPLLKYNHYSEPAKVTISFNGNGEKIAFGPVTELAVRTLPKQGPDSLHAYNHLETSVSVILQESVVGRNVEETFLTSLQGLFDAIHIPDLKSRAEATLRHVSQHIFEAEIRRIKARDLTARATPTFLSPLLDAFPHALAREQPEQIKIAQALVASLIESLVLTTQRPDVSPQDILPILHNIANRFSALCLEDPWVRKNAGCTGISILIQTQKLGLKWVADREADFVRTLLHILKDLPHDLPRDVDDVVAVLLDVLNVSNADLNFQAEGPSNPRNKLIHLVGIFIPELQSQNPIVRKTAQTCIALLVKLSGRQTGELFHPHRDRMLAGIFTKPLRALPFPRQIGMMEAVRYCLHLEPPLIELNEELLRLLHETLALADAEDNALLGRGPTRQQASADILKLRVACIKLLTASMPITDFFSRQPQTRQKVTSVYFKSLYSVSQEVKDVAHEGLRMVLTHQSRLPKELLQTGLRPILMNLADPKRLSIPGLEGLARLLELLTNYFKVEIGHKLLDHFRVVADSQMLQLAARGSLPDNEGITKLVRLANIFHLLPVTANVFLESLVNLIVQTEAQMHFSTRSPFSEPLAKYLNRYPGEAIDFFIRHIRFPRHLRTLRSIIQAKLAPNLERELASRTIAIVTQFLHDPTTVIPVLLILKDLSDLIPTWIAENELVIEGLIAIWHNDSRSPEATRIHRLVLGIFMTALEQTPRIDLLFEVISIFSRDLAMDLIRVSHFLYRRVALNEDIIFRRNVLMRFLTWFDNPSVSWSDKSHFIRYIVTPTLLVEATRPSSKQQLIDVDFVDRIHRSIWAPITESISFSETDEMFKIEVLHLTTVMVMHYKDLLGNVKKDIIKCAWFYITSSEDIVVKQTAYLLAARFFAAFSTPSKFILRAWTGLLRSPNAEGRAAIRQEALAVLAPCLPKLEPGESGHPPWAKATRRLLAEEGLGQLIAIYHLIIKQPQLFFPVRSLFVPHMANSLNKLGMSPSSSAESRLLSLEILQVIFNWEKEASQLPPNMDPQAEPVWLTPLGFRESMVSYLVRLSTLPHEAPARATLLPRALNLLQAMVGPSGWNDVTVGLRFFSRALEQNDLGPDSAGIPQAITSAKALQVIASEQNDAWYTANAPILHKLVRKGLVSEDATLQDALHPIFDTLMRLFPLPKEEEEQPGELWDFHSFVYSSIGEGLRNSTALRGTLLMLKSVVAILPERIEPFLLPITKLVSKMTKDHASAVPSTQGYENSVRPLISILDICITAIAFLGDQRRWLLTTLVVLVDKSKSLTLGRYLLDIARRWSFSRQDPYPTMKEKASLIQKMPAFEGRSDTLYHSFLELIHEIYTDPGLRRSDLTTRLEYCFLLGCRAKDANLREKFIDLLDSSVPRSIVSRITYILGVQTWDALADHQWIYLALHLILGAADVDLPAQRHGASTPNAMPRLKAHQVLRPVQRLLFLDPQVAHDVWVSVFPAVWRCLSRREQGDLTHHMINLLSKDYHIKQAHLRPNIVQTLLAGIHASQPAMILPPHLVKYLAKTFGAWHVSLEILSSSLEYVKDDEPTVRDYVYDSLADIYAELAEDDLFYGVWRRRSLHLETNIALSYEQNGMWEQAANMYEIAQNRSRAGTIAFSETELCLWEDHWVLAAEKLQHWDVLYDMAKSEGNHELLLESAWRVKDWPANKETFEEHISQLPEGVTPRRRVFEAFIALLKLPGAVEKNTDFTKIIDDAMQLSLRKWVNLPPYLSIAHVPLLQHFQQIVELQEAVQIFGSLVATNASNLEKKSSELKMVLQAWRERLPNHYDDINIWSDLVAWRQNVFHSINAAYIPLINNSNQGSGPANNNASTFGYRGYHETAWIINRFAHVARKHDLLDVCFTFLTKIYTLPNIEISEAFLKLREQARCHYQRPNDLQAGLEVINNTNLMFFSVSQKAEFYTLKAMFHARFGRTEEANAAFGQAVQLEMSQAKAWAQWGRFSDRMFKENPTDLSHAANAVSCYLQAAGLYKSGKSRPLLARVLWLLSIDDHHLAISKAFDTYKGEGAHWWWITLIPQLCMSISHREAKQARSLLSVMAKHYPQALFYQLRTTREEMQILKRTAAARAASLGQPDPTIRRPVNGDQIMKDGTETANNEGANQTGDASSGSQSQAQPQAPEPTRHPWDHIEDIMQVLKTTFPLLILSLETVVDQIQHKFKLAPEEEVYRNICMLLSDGLQSYVLKMNAQEDDGLLQPQTVQTLIRMSQNMPSIAKKEYEEDFVTSKPNQFQYVQRLQRWRDRYEAILDSRPRLQPLALLSHYLTEFQYTKVDEIEVPGQYTEDKDGNQTFVKIQRFAQKFENYRANGACWKRFTLHGNDNSKISFTVQLPCHRQYRREERVLQLFRSFNGTLNRKKETRKRNLHFHVPIAVNCSPSVRLAQTDSSYITMGDIYEQHCESIGISKEEPTLYAAEKVKKGLRDFRQGERQLTKTEYITLKKDVHDEVAGRLVPDDVLTRFMTKTMAGPMELWRMRKQFGLQLASSSVMTFAVCLSSRVPSRFHISRESGLMFMTELLPGYSNQLPVFATSDVVPFRYTPVMQHFLGPIFAEGILTSGIMAIGRSLTEPEFDLEQQLYLFARDEVGTWMSMRGRAWTADNVFRQTVAANVDGVVKRMESLACKVEREQANQNNGANARVPVVQTVTNLISNATNPIQLAKMGEPYIPWF